MKWEKIKKLKRRDIIRRKTRIKSWCIWNGNFFSLGRFSGLFSRLNNAKVSDTFSGSFLNIKSMIISGMIIGVICNRTFFFSISDEWILSSKRLLSREGSFFLSPHCLVRKFNSKTQPCKYFLKIPFLYRKTRKKNTVR